MTLWLGPALAAPAPLQVVEALTGVEVNLNAEGRDGFQLTFSLGRGPGDIVDYPLLANPLLRPFSRVIIQVWMGVAPEVLIDGFITKHQVNPGNEPGSSTLVITGEDVRVMMDLREFSLPYPQMSPDVRVRLMLAKYALYLGAPPMVLPPITLDVPILFERIPAQSGTDLRYIEELAREVSYVFYVEPTLAPMVNLAYWGPENRLSIPQSALSVNMGPATNVTSLNFNYDALGPTTVLGTVQDKRLGLVLPVMTFASLRPPLAPLPALLVQQPNVRSELAHDTAGLDPIQAFARAQAVTDRSADALSADGELDALRYNGLLRARRLVGVRGAGFLLDGFYFVKRVTHSIKKGEYKQRFSLTREGFGAMSPVVVP
ncbi:MAG: hypothetical protein H0W08_06910 [Acidobacteria bacterium]|nr:hypothetical protein [Acidobacteriota bacterium]